MPKDLDAATIAAIRANAPAVKNGTYTVSDERHEGKHFTLKLWTSTKGPLAGKRILSLLTGPDNTGDYEGVAFWNDELRRVNVWRRYKSETSRQPIDGYGWQNDWSIVERKLAVWCDLAVRGSTEERHGYWYDSGMRMLVEGRCVRCNRALTVPESIEAGIGPECASKAGGVA